MDETFQITNTDFSTPAFFPYIIIGQLTRDYILSPGGIALNDRFGGNAFYAASGVHHWEKTIGLISRISSDYPQEWIDRLKSLGLETKGIKRLPFHIEDRNFFAYNTDIEMQNRSDLFKSYCDADLPFPKGLIGYTPQFHQIDSIKVRSDQTIVTRDIPNDYLNVRCIHFCPADYLTHILIPMAFPDYTEKTITIEAGKGYMVPEFWDRIPGIIQGMSAFITSEAKIRALFREQYSVTDLWEMAEQLLDYGVKSIVIRRDDRQVMLLESSHRKRITLSPYPNKVVLLTGEGSAFCGGFLAGLNETYDPVEALVYGAAAASFVTDASDPFTTFDVLPGLIDARIEVLRNLLQTEK